MQYSWIDFALVAACLIGSAILALLILKNGLIRRWPFLFLNVVFDIALNILLRFEAANYSAYSHIYWIGAGLKSVLSFGLLYDSVRSLHGSRYLPKRLGILFVVICTTCAVGAFFVSLGHHTTSNHFVDTAIMLDDCACTAWMAFAVVMLGCISFMGFAWSRQSLQITGGFVIFVASSLIAEHAMRLYPNLTRPISICNSIIYLVVLFSWTYSVAIPAVSEHGYSINAVPGLESRDS